MIPATPKPEPPPESVTDPFAFLSRLEDLRAECAWASDTIEGIYTTVTRSGRVTEGQLRAIDNIEDGARRHGRRW